jgi:hypothetical protein
VAPFVSHLPDTIKASSEPHLLRSVSSPFHFIP